MTPSDYENWKIALKHRYAYFALYERTPIWQVRKRQRRYSKWHIAVGKCNRFDREFESHCLLTHGQHPLEMAHA